MAWNTVNPFAAHAFFPFDSGEEAARMLVLTVLSAAEQDALSQQGYLDIPSVLVPKRTYRISPDERAYVLFAGTIVGKFCLTTTIELPLWDMFLLEKLLLEGDEERYLATANIWLTRATSCPDQELVRLYKWKMSHSAVLWWGW